MNAEISAAGKRSGVHKKDENGRPRIGDKSALQAIIIIKNQSHMHN
ncbi:hypothetical protein P9858_18115 [Niallia circulans]|nr:hypothetical protein [Niallia circulans]